MDLLTQLFGIMEDINTVQDEFKTLSPEKQQDFIKHMQRFTYDMVDFAEDNSKEN